MTVRTIVSVVCGAASHGGITELVLSYLARVAAVCALAMLLIGAAERLGGKSGAWRTPAEELHDALNSR